MKPHKQSLRAFELLVLLSFTDILGVCSIPYKIKATSGTFHGRILPTALAEYDTASAAAATQLKVPKHECYKPPGVRGVG